MSVEREPLYRDEEWLRDQYVNKLKTSEEIAAELGVGQTTISEWLDRHGIETRSTGHSPLDDGGSVAYRDEAWLREQYIDEERTSSDIAEECCVSQETVLKWLHRHDIETRSIGFQSNGDTEPLHDEAWLREQYIEKEKSSIEIARELEVSDSSVSRWLSRHGIETRSAYPPEDDDLKTLRDEEWLRERYHGDGLTQQEMADEINVSESAVSYWMREYGIETTRRKR